MTLEDRVFELEETVRQLRDLLRPMGQFPADWQLSPTQTRIVAAMTRNGEISADAGQAAGSTGKDKITHEHLRQQIRFIRLKLEPFGVTIASAWGRGGYWLAGDSLSIVRAAFSPAGRVEK